jgi:hypothetical protein
MPNGASHGIALATLGSILVATTLIAVPSAEILQVGDRAPRSRFATLAVSKDTRLLIVSPHPDDEVLAAGGLIQHLRAANGTLRVVYLTDGEGYKEGVQIEDHVAAPTPSNYRAYGRQRTREAHRALRVLGFGPESLMLLGFPKGGF